MRDHDKFGRGLVQWSRLLLGIGIIISAVLVIVSVRDTHENLLYAAVISMVGIIILCKILEAAGHGIVLMNEQNENSKKMIELLEKQDQTEMIPQTAPVSADRMWSPSMAEAPMAQRSTQERSSGNCRISCARRTATI